MIIILYVMDALRPDFLSCYGYGKKTSPHIDQLAREGVLFTNAFAQSTWTRPSGASLLTSTYPSVHGVLTPEDALPKGLSTLPEKLKGNGFQTIAFSSMANISPYFGFERGFDRFVEVYKERGLIEESRKERFKNLKKVPQLKVKGVDVPVVTSEDIHNCLIPFLKGNLSTDVFVLVWSLDTHNPYFHRDVKLARYCEPTEKIYSASDVLGMRREEEFNQLRRLYEDMIYYNDHQIGRLVSVLRDLDLFDRTFFILTSDHGESFGEHRIRGHGGAPYDEQIRVPLILKFPRGEFVGQISGLAQHIDLMPTLLEYRNMKGDDVLIQGRSLIPLLKRQAIVNHFIFVESWTRRDLPRFAAIRTADFKYMESRPGRMKLHRSFLQTLSPVVRVFFRQRLLFDLNQDSLERTNLARRAKEITHRFRVQVKNILAANGEMARTLEKTKYAIPEDDEVMKQLRTLGYFE